MPSRREIRRGHARARQETRAKRTPQEQLAILDARFGKGGGAAKERARLAKALAEPPKEQPPAEAFAENRETVMVSEADLAAKGDRLAKAHMDGENVHSVGIGDGTLVAYASNPAKANIPEEFEGVRVPIHKAGRPRPLKR
jgi:hypothetical protein